MTALHHAPLVAQARRVLQASGPVPSPCVSVCRLDAVTHLCEGCLRTLDEIALWSQLPDDDKRSVWRQLVQRAQSAAPAAPPFTPGGSA